MFTNIEHCVLIVIGGSEVWLVQFQNTPELLRVMTMLLTCVNYQVQGHISPSTLN